jgi:predicted esterase
VPDGYTGSVSVPLLIGAHGMGGDGQWIRDFLAAEANNRTWLLAAPDMHGSYYINTGEYALAWPGAQHDIIDTIEYMISEYEVDPSRIYIAGGSMGGQTAAVMAAKYPDVFAAASPWKPITKLADWYYHLRYDFSPTRWEMLNQIRREIDPSCNPGSGGDNDYISGCGTPVQAPFEYQRRSPIEMPQNSRLIPIKMWHDQLDVLVPIHHSYDLRDAINSWNPLTPVMVIDPSVGGCPPDQHCYSPAPADVFDYLESFTLSSQPPLSLAIRTDESKPYYWLNLAQTGGDHWSEVEAAYSLANKTVAATISDTNPLTVAFNLGSMPITGSAGLPQAGMGLSATTYQIKEGNKPPYLQHYTSGYLTVTLSTTGQFSLTISAIASDLHKIYLPIVMKE